MKKMYINRNNRRLYTGRRGMYRVRRTSGVSYIMLVAVILLIAAATYSVMNTIKDNKSYKEYMDTGNKLYYEQDYAQALTAYLNANEYSHGHNEAEIGIFNCYINTDVEEGVDYATELVKGGITEEAFLTVVSSVNQVDPGSAYKLLEDYVADKKSVNENIQTLIDASAKKPEMPVLNILQGTYVKLENVTFKPQDSFGNSIYYTYNAEAPNQYSMEYRGGFAVEESCDIRVRSFNAIGEGSETARFSFIIDKSMGQQLSDLIDKAEKLGNSVNIGVKKGECSQLAVDKLNKTLNEAKALMEQDNVLFMDAENYVEYLQQAMNDFKKGINKDVSKTQVGNLVKFGTEVYNSVNKSIVANDLSEELKQLNSAITAATKSYNADGTQNQLNEAYYTLYEKLFAVNTKGWKSAYEKVVFETGGDYLVYDINFDDIPELVIQQDNVTMFYAYSVSMGEAVNINMDKNVKYDIFFNNRQGLLSCVGDSETGDFRLMTYKDNKITLSDSLHEYNDNVTLRTGLKPLEFKKYTEYTVD